ncbi:MAG: GFA family protein [Gammaproteobacteria bacterium]
MGTIVFTGGCLCGAVRYEANAEPSRCMLCHCEFCRKHSGAPCLSFVHFPAENFRWVKGQPKRFRSSEYAERGFCAVCGSTLTMHEEILQERVQVTLGSLDDPGRVSPDDHVWVQSKISWFDVADDLPRFDRSSSAVSSRAEED